jgi:hypothetical protein
MMDEKEVMLCAEWIRLFCVPADRKNYQHESYGLKHAVERWLNRKGTPQHIHEEAFLEAARREGYARLFGGGDGYYFKMKFSKEAFPKPEPKKARDYL